MQTRRTEPLRRLWGLLDPRERVSVAILVAMMVVAAGLEILGIGMVLPFISLLSKPDLVRSNAWLRSFHEFLGFPPFDRLLLVLGAILLAVYVVKNAYLWLVVYVQSRLVFDKQAAMSRRLLESYLCSPYSFHLQRNSAGLLKNITTEVNGAFYGYIQPLLTLVTEGLVLCFIVAFLLAVEPRVALVALGVIGVTGYLVQMLLRRTVIALGDKRSACAGQMYQLVNQALGGAKEAKVLGRERYFLEEFNEASDAYARTTRLLVTLNALPRPFMETIIVGGLLASVAVMVAMRIDMTQTLPVLALFAMAAIRILPSVTRIFVSANSMRFYYPALDAVCRDVDLLSAHAGSATAAAQADTATAGPLPLQHKLEVRDVWYRYAGVEAWGLKGVSVTIGRGTSAALVGPTGAGKSTLIDLILGLLDPERGSILVDDGDIRRRLRGWQQSIGYVPQSIYLLDDTIRRNVAFGIGASLIDDAKVWAALRMASFDDAVRSFPKGLDTPVGERGTRLSGGERQRIGIARALYHDPEVIILDEATSSLDSTTEHDVSKALEELARRKTFILIAHRLSTVQHCDQLIFMKDGAIAAVGKFSELVENNAEFADLVRNQSLFVA